MAEPREAKLRKLDAFRRRLPHLSASALSQLLTELVRDAAIVPELYARTAIRQARDVVNNEPTPFGPIHRSVNVHAVGGGCSKINVVHPLALLWKALTLSQEFSEFVRRRFDAAPSTPERPWSVILNSDEVTPGNPLSTSNERKLQVIYFSFAEFGANALSHEEAWFTIMAERSVHIKKVCAGMSQAFSAIIGSLFDGSGTNMRTGGAELPLHGGNARIFAKLGAVVQDGGAHKLTWHSRGDGALRLCLLCHHLFTDKSKVCDEDGTHLLRCNVMRHEDLALATGDQVRRAARFLEANAAVRSKPELTHLEMALGMTHHPHALLLNRALDEYVDPCEAFVQDWMHGLFVDGVYNVTVYLLLEECITNGRKDIYAMVGGCIASWYFPGRIGHKSSSRHFADIFSSDKKDKHRNAAHIKCQASELLSISGVLALFVQRVLLKSNTCNDACVAFLALSDVVDFVRSANRGTVTSDVLAGAVRTFLARFTSVWGFEWLTPKFSALRAFLAPRGQVMGPSC
ncbi:unnamed protein product [Prorocentrum cordatum]|uniref:Uncharacterized protein n=1 Tax=Prorocentrum cordatum TaxID=2364126 RepID=A0ABN9TDE6_9DINO|nr:unnamed protein product [Polarella glacialis]